MWQVYDIMTQALSTLSFSQPWSVPFTMVTWWMLELQLLHLLSRWEKGDEYKQTLYESDLPPFQEISQSQPKSSSISHWPERCHMNPSSE